MEYSTGNTIGSRIRYYRNKAGLSQMELEVAIEAAPGSVSRIENDKVNPTKETVLGIARVLKLSVSETTHLLGVYNTELSEPEKSAALTEFQAELENPAVLGYLLDTRSCILAISAGFELLAHKLGMTLKPLVGHHVAEVVLDPRFHIRNFLGEEHFAETAKTLLAILYYEKHQYLQEEWWKDLLHRLLELPGIEKLWQEIQTEKPELYTRSARTVHFNLLGADIPMTYSITNLQIDPRFTFCEYIPEHPELVHQLLSK